MRDDGSNGSQKSISSALAARIDDSPSPGVVAAHSPLLLLSLNEIVLLPSCCPHPSALRCHQPRNSARDIDSASSNGRPTPDEFAGRRVTVGAHVTIVILDHPICELAAFSRLQNLSLGQYSSSTPSQVRRPLSVDDFISLFPGGRDTTPFKDFGINVKQIIDYLIQLESPKLKLSVRYPQQCCAFSRFSSSFITITTTPLTTAPSPPPCGCYNLVFGIID